MYATIAADRDSEKIKAIKKLEAAAACVGTEDFPLPLYFNQLEKLKTYISEETVEPEDEKAQEFLVQQLSRLENVGCRPRGILKANAACQTGAVHCEQTYALSTFAMSCESRNAEGEILQVRSGSRLGIIRIMAPVALLLFPFTWAMCRVH